MPESFECPNCGEGIPADAGRGLTATGRNEIQERDGRETECPKCDWKLIRANNPDSAWQVDRRRQRPDED